MLHRICSLQDYLPSCWHVSTRPNSYVRFDWSVIFRIRFENQHILCNPDPKNNQPIKSHIGIRPHTVMSTWWKVVLQTANSVKHCFKVADKQRWWQKGIKISKIYSLSFKWVPILLRIRSRHQYKTILNKCCMKIWHLRFLPCGFF
jgi:hypothetical protein